MAAHGTPEYTTAAGNDYPTHEATYENFTFLILVGILFVITICLGLTVGGVKDNWLIGGGLIFLGTIAAVTSLLMKAKQPSYIMLVLGFLALAFA